MYPSTGATIRADINTVVIEADQADNFFIGTDLMPEFGVDAKSGTYAKLTKTNTELLNVDSTLRQRGSSYGEVTRAWASDTYDTLDRGVEEAIDDTDAKDVGRFFGLEQLAASTCLRSIRLAHEIRVAAAIFNTTNFGSATNSAVAYTEANIATIDFVQDVQAAIERVNDRAEIANTIVMSPSVYNRLRRSTLLKSFIVGQNIGGANITLNTIQQAFAAEGIEKVLVGRSRYNGAKKGQTYSASKVWSDTYVWVGSVKGGDFMAGGAGRTLVWNAEGGIFVSESYRNESRRSNMVRVRQHTAEKIVNGEAGTLIATQYA